MPSTLHLKKSKKSCINTAMKLFKYLSLTCIFCFLIAPDLFGQLYSYRTPSGRLLITDKAIKKPGYKLLSSKGTRKTRKASRFNRKYQLSSNQIDTLVKPIAKTYNVDANLIKAVIEVESSRNYRVVSHKGAQGLMQLIPSTAIRFGVRNAFNPSENIRGGTKYLRFLLGYFEGNVDHVLAAYNAGEVAVDNHGGIPPFKETRNYIRKIRKLYTKTRLPFDKNVSYRSKLISNSKKPSIRPVGKVAKVG
ncbi:MAG: hypothetical protein CR997_02050 [Acidobacteria bacterium]|nr:MAG: hypothetical protein CR997_02050 [Acidobacteriota bacterium]